MGVKLLSIEEVAARTQLAPSTIYEQIRKGQFPGSVPIGLTRRRGFVESQIEAFIEAHAARDRSASSASTKSDGRDRFWADVAAGKRLHPRTVGRLKRERAQGCTSQWVVVVNGRGGENREQFAADRADAQRLLERLRKENPTAAAWMCERVTRHQVPAQESDDAGAS
jgi:predicted DNA-binding transcriptional regulator AlpA